MMLEVGGMESIPPAYAGGTDIRRIRKVSRHISEILGQILMIVFVVVAGGTPIVVLVLSILNFTRIKTRRVAIALKALAALAIWAFLAFSIIMVLFMVVFEVPAFAPQATIFALVILIYALAGGGLIYWMKRQSKLLPAAPALP